MNLNLSLVNNSIEKTIVFLLSLTISILFRIDTMAQNWPLVLVPKSDAIMKISVPKGPTQAVSGSFIQNNSDSLAILSQLDEKISLLGYNDSSQSLFNYQIDIRDESVPNRKRTPTFLVAGNFAGKRRGDSGVQDLVVGISAGESSGFIFLKNDGKGSFSKRFEALWFADEIDGYPKEAATADLNQDGLLDLVILTASPYGGRLSIFLNLGDTRFDQALTFSKFRLFNINPSSVALGDMTGDTWPDLVLGFGSQRLVSVMRNKGNVGQGWDGFDEPGPQSFGNFTPEGIVDKIKLIDLNGDEHLDVMALLTGVKIVQYAYNSGNQSFLTSTGEEFVILDDPSTDFVVGDFNLDTHFDLAATSIHPTDSPNTTAWMMNLSFLSGDSQYYTIMETGLTSPSSISVLTTSSGKNIFAITDYFNNEVVFVRAEAKSFVKQ